MPRIALAQIDTTVGDIDANARAIVDAIRAAAAQGAHLVLLPELAISGYPPEDLLAKDHFVDDGIDALGRVAAACTGIAALVGFVDRDGDVLYNAAALCRAGRVEAVYRKHRLPNYGVFDEARYFAPGDVPLSADIEGVRTALTICEDVWLPELAAEAVGLGERLLLNISASPFHAGKGVEREAMLAKRAADNGVWLAYCNLVGGQDELVFDGRSVVIGPDGSVQARALAFEEDLLVVDVPEAGALLPAGAGSRVERRLDGEEEVYRALCSGLRDYIRKNGFRDVVVGLSGGIDSALTAVLAADALGPEHVHGVMMPSRYSSPGSLADAASLCANLGIECRTLPVEEPFAALLDTLAGSFEGREPDITEENLQARIRGTLLMALSNKFGWIVLATGNKSELSVGYSTLYGDMVGGFAPIKDLYKTRVYDLARWRNLGAEVIPAASITKPPSAELRPGQQDTDSLPPYDILDAVLRRYIEQDMSRDEIVAEGFDADLVARIARLVDAAEYKRRQGPMGIRVTPKAFGKDRRMPVTNRYRG
ncbi:MAG: NAD+ synthase [Coriobacteriia bacterium]|nr:NAD+ synthase [Coriobacteriia bacterium]